MTTGKNIACHLDLKNTQLNSLLLCKTDTKDAVISRLTQEAIGKDCTQHLTKSLLQSHSLLTVFQEAIGKDNMQ